MGIQARSPLPSTAVLEMTFRCNHSCLYCSCPWEAPGGGYPAGREMSPEEWCRLIDLLIDEHQVSRIAFTGGEPTLKEGLREVVRYARGKTATFVADDPEGRPRAERRPPELHIITNGRLLDGDWEGFFAENMTNVSISLPGLETYRRHTGHGDAQDALDRMRSLSGRGVHVTANITVTALNRHELFETIGTALLHGADFLLLNRFLPGGRGLANAAALSLSAEQIREALVTAEGVLQTANRPGSVGTEIPRCLADGLVFSKLRVGTRCSAGRSFFAVDPAGRVRVCNHSPTPLGHWRDMAQIISGKYWRRFAFKEFMPEACGRCELKGSCDAGCREAAHVAGGSPDAPDPAFPGGARWKPTTP